MTPEAQALADEIKRLARDVGHEARWNDLTSAIDRLAAMAQPAVPQGWRVVPVEPTDEMIDATYHGQPLADIWRDMLAASPTPSQGAEPSTSTGGEG